MNQPSFLRETRLGLNALSLQTQDISPFFILRVK